MSVQAALLQAHRAALARRAEGQPEAVRALLQARLQRLPAAPAAVPAATAPWAPRAPRPASALAELLAELAALAEPAGQAEQAAMPPSPHLAHQAQPPHVAPARTRHELKAVRDYRSTWSRLAVAQRLHQALASVPSNAGPLNTQRLVHQALRTLNMLSPAYLQRLVVQGEALLWLEQLSAPPSREIGGTPGPGRSRKG